MARYKQLIVLLLAGVLTSCAVATLNTDAARVEIANEPLKLASCQYLGEVIGSEGHWYTYFFLANRTLMQAAVNDLRNQAAAIGADTVFIDEPFDFTTSVTILGIAYRCKK